MAYIYPFRMASGTATMMPIDPRTREIITGIRADTAWVYPGYNSLAGGFMEARFTEEQAEKQSIARKMAMDLLDIKLVADEFHEGENLEECAVRELREELNIEVNISQLNMFAVRSNSRTDTRAHVINTCYWFELTKTQAASLTAGDDLKGIDRVSFDDITAEREMAFNHREVMIQGFRDYQKQKLFEHLLTVHLESRVVDDFLKDDHVLAEIERLAANG